MAQTLQRLTPGRLWRGLRRRARRWLDRKKDPVLGPPTPPPDAVPPARGSIDSPDIGTPLHRTAEALAGWALRGKDGATSVRIVVNEQMTVDADVVGIDRPDVLVGLGDDSVSSACGWRATLDLRRLPPGDAHVKLLVRVEEDGEDRWALVAHYVYPLRGHGIVGNVDDPKDGVCVSGELLVVTGWAHSHRTIDSVEVECDGKVLGLARLGVSRLDVASEDEGIGPLCGYEFRGVVDLGVEGARTVSVSATDLDGSRASLGTMSVTFRPHEPTEEERLYGERLSRLNEESVAVAASEREYDPRSVLVFTHSVALGGGQLYLQDLIREIRPSLNRVVLMTPFGGALGPELEEMGVDIVISGRGWDYDIASYEGHIRQLQHLIVGSGCGVVLCNTLGQFAAADAAQRVGIPVIWALHESMEIADWIDRNSVGTPVSAYVRSRIEAALTGARRLVFEADATRRLYLQVTGAPERAVTVNYAVDVAAIDAHIEHVSRSALRSRLDLPQDAVVLLCVGVYEDRKSQGSIIEAFRHVADAHPSAMLALVGDHPCPLSVALHRAVPEHLADRIRLVPITPDIWDWYRAADVLVSASDVESLPRSMLESMLFECPVLSVAVFGIPELIRDGENGWLVEERDMASLIAGFHRVLRMDRAAWAAAGAKGRAIVVDQYRSDRFGDAYLLMIDELARR